MKSRIECAARNHATRLRTAARFAMAIGLGFGAPSALATPSGWEFVTGDGYGFINQVGPAGQTVTSVFLPGETVWASNRHIINWDSLDVGTQETLNFNGQNGYMVLNRIDGLGSPTQIDGALNAMTGHVYIMNSAGVMFGQDSVINVSSLHAAAANWADGDQLQTDFLKGNPLSFQTSGDVEFAGTLMASDAVSLIGQRVRNSGSISGAAIVMAIGDTVVIDDLGSRISVKIVDADGDVHEMDDTFTASAGDETADITTGDPGILNSGTVTASEGGQVSLAAGDMLGLGLSIQHSGEIHAQGGDVDVLAAGGAVWTTMAGDSVAQPGLVDVTDPSQAGSIDIVGPAVVLESSAEANGHAGQISVQGFSNVILAGEAALVADGGFATADGGTIRLEAAEGTVLAESGTGLSAKGGLFGGNGGLIEIDAQSLELAAVTKLGAIAGDQGRLVIESLNAVTVDAVDEGLTPYDPSNLSTSVLAPGETGRISALTGDTLSSVDGNLELTTGDPLRLEATLLGLRADATFTSDEIQLAITDATQEIRAYNLTFNGHVVHEDHARLGAEARLSMLGGGVSGDGTSLLSLDAVNEVRLEGRFGAGDAKIGDLLIGSGSQISFLGGESRTGQEFVIEGDLQMGPALPGVGVEVTATAADDLVLLVGGNVILGEGAGALFSIEQGQGVHIQSGGTLENYSSVLIDGDLMFQAESVSNNSTLDAAGGITLNATSGALNTTGTLITEGDISLAAGTSLTNAVDYSQAGGSVTLRSWNDNVANSGNLTSGIGVTLIGEHGTVSNTGTLEAPDVVLQGGIGVSHSGTITSTGSVLLSSTTDRGVGGGMVDSAGTITADGAVTMLGDAGVHIQDAASAGSVLTASSSAGEVTVDATVSGSTLVALTSELGTVAGSGTVTGGELSVTGGAINFEGVLESDGSRGAGDITLTATSGDLEVSETTALGGSVTATSAGAITTTGAVSGDGVTLTAATDATIGDAITSGAAIDITATSG
ncbi:MAG: filamentous hemagglutinin N-terminal domain-containing protein, partial [Phycisphaerales bacterium]|nr:filamentous hemagglutinin N-terminal domain-containing protein [Phycisphaerales bacterium]